MNLEYSNFYYFNKEHLLNKNNSFNVTIKDLDKEINNGEPFVYTFCEVFTSNPSKLEIQVLSDFKDGKFKDVKIAEFVDERTLEEVKQSKIKEIDNIKKYLLEYDSVFYDDDIFSITDTSLLRISGIIQNYTLYLNNKMITEDEISQVWISETDVQHMFTFKQLLELSKLMMEKVQDIVCHANILKTTEIDKLKTIEEVENLNWNSI